MSNTVLVTGGAGYIGSHAAKALARDGYQPIVLDNLSCGHPSAAKWGPLVAGNIADEALVRHVVEAYAIRAVIHFAASAYVGESMVDPARYFDNNVANSLHLLNAMIGTGVRLLVYSSTCATYGNPEYVPIDEEHPQKPVNPYGESKLFIEKVLRWYDTAHGLRSVCLRYFNAAGADPDGDVGESHIPETHIIPLAIHAAIGWVPVMSVLGTDYETPDGTAIRDFIHVSDLGEAHVHALRYLQQGGDSTNLNIGTGVGHSVYDVIRSVERVSRRHVRLTEAPRRHGDPAVLVARADKAKDLLGWKPRITNLDDIVETAWHWHIGVKSMFQQGWKPEIVMHSA